MTALEAKQQSIWNSLPEELTQKITNSVNLGIRFCEIEKQLSDKAFESLESDLNSIGFKIRRFKYRLRIEW